MTPKEQEFINKNIKQKLVNALENLQKDADKTSIEIHGCGKNMKIEDKSDVDMTEPDYLKQEDDTRLYDKYVNIYCNIYHDFDAHSEEYRSYLVKIFILFLGIQLDGSCVLHT